MGGGVPESTNGTNRTAQLLLFSNRLLVTMSFRPPEITIPVPTGPRSAEPCDGTVVLLLSCTKLSWNTQHEPVPVGPRPVGHLPSCGDGASSLFWLFVEKPVLL